MTGGLAVAFRFNKERHEYIDAETSEVLKHVTGMIEAAGWVDTTFMNEEGRRRGSAVHDLTAHFDLGALDLESCQSEYKGYLQAHVRAMSILRPEILAVEEPLVSVQTPRWGGRPDRVWRLSGVISIPEIKSGPVPSSKPPSGSVAGRGATEHSIQTALQAILVGPTVHLPPEAIDRYGLYLQAHGQFRLRPFTDKADFNEARRIVREYCR